MTRRSCKTCKHYWCAVMSGDGEPFEDDGICRDPAIHRGGVQSDDLCNNYKEAAWAKRRLETANGEDGE